MSENLQQLFEGAVARDKAGEGSEALRLLDALLEYDPAHRMGLFYRGGLKIRYRKDVEGGLKDWEGAFEGAPAGSSARVRQAFPLFLDSCLDRLAQLTGLEPHNASYHSTYGRACRLFDNPVQAERHLDRALALDKSRWLDALRLGDLWRLQGKEAEALKLLQAQVEATPEEAEIHFWLAERYLEQKRSAQTLKHLEAAIKHNPRHLKARQQLAQLLLTQGRMEQAQQHFLMLLEASPSAQVYLGLAECDKQQFRYDEALEHFRKASQLDPANFTALYELGSLAIQFGDLNLGITSLQAALRLEPNHADLYGMLARAAIQQGRTAEAISALRHQLRLEPGDSYAIYNLATQLRAQGEAQEAAQLLERLLESKPGDVPVSLELAECLVPLGRAVEATALLCEAHERNPNHDDVKQALDRLAPGAARGARPQKSAVEELLNLARAHLQAGRGAEAFEAFRKVLAEQPHNAEALRQVGRLYAGRKMFEPACDCLLRSYLSQPSECSTLLELFDVLYQMSDAGGRAFLLQMATRLPQAATPENSWLMALWSERERPGVKRWLHNLMVQFPQGHPLQAAWARLQQTATA